MPERNRPFRLTILGIGLLVSVAGGGLARGQEASAVIDPQAIELELKLERRLLAGDVTAYRDARTREVGARLRADELAVRFDEQLVAVDAIPLRAAREAAAARDELSHAEGRATQALATITERLRRIAQLQRLRPQSFGVPLGVKAEEGLAGRWQVALDSGGPFGVFELKLAESVVFGSLLMPEGSTIAIRGSHDAPELRLEPVQIVGAPTRTFIGTLDPASGQLEGSWQGSDPATGQPLSAGTWTATRLPAPQTEPIQQEDIE